MQPSRYALTPGVLLSGPITLANNASTALLQAGPKGDDESEEDDEQEATERRKAASGVKAGRARRGKTGIRNGLFNAGSDDD